MCRRGVIYNWNRPDAVPSGTIKNIPTTAFEQRTEQMLDFLGSLPQVQPYKGVTGLACRRVIATFL